MSTKSSLLKSTICHLGSHEYKYLVGKGILGGLKKLILGSFSRSMPANTFVFELTFDELDEDESKLDEDACSSPHLKTK